MYLELTVTATGQEPTKKLINLATAHWIEPKPEHYGTVGETLITHPKGKGIIVTETYKEIKNRLI